MTDNDINRSERHRAESDARDWLVRLSSGTLSETELERFKAWRDHRPENRAAFDRERHFWKQMDLLDGAADIPQLPTTPSMTRRAMIGGGAAAMAASVAVLTAPTINTWWKADYIVPAGGQQELPLPDGTVIALNSGSAIKIDYRHNLRLVHLLRGDAEFGVARDPSGSRFRVAASNGITDVEEGQISINMVRDTTTVAVVSGYALVASPVSPDVVDIAGSMFVDLKAAQQTRYASGMAPDRPSTADMEMVLAWRQGKIIFEGRPFATAIDEIARYVYEPVLLGPGIDRSVQVSGVFSTNDPVAALRSVARTQDLSVRRIPGVAIMIS
ncbi:FecR family protein [Agrobacterium tumefaciens]|uniref:FecR family protein n=1 Tax=Agrobacterium tumefaciens TaxID=358 RepID=UPI0021D12096|nr:FecR domain-containing protein [Agrobacterium tumefaciens]UXS03753.1 DUF4880 domain-containing protein [Agrobacterium tumefaciens]